jgi:hypothetical protein
MESKREELQRALAGLGERGRGKPYPKALLKELVAYGSARREEGATLIAIGEELGVSWRSLSRWITERTTSKQFRRVEVVAPPPQKVVVRAPHGVSIEGLDVADLADLLRRLDA